MDHSTDAAAGERTPFARMSVGLLFFLGGYILVAPYFPTLSCWDRLTASVGGEAVFLRICIGLLFVYFATLVLEKNGLKALTHDILEAFNVMMYGKEYRRHRTVVADQIARLESARPEERAAAHRVLRELTKQDLPEDHAVWSVWWSHARRTFRIESAASERGESSRASRRAPERTAEAATPEKSPEKLTAGPGA